MARTMDDCDALEAEAAEVDGGMVLTGFLIVGASGLFVGAGLMALVLWWVIR